MKMRNKTRKRKIEVNNIEIKNVGKIAIKKLGKGLFSSQMNAHHY